MGKKCFYDLKPGQEEWNNVVKNFPELEKLVGTSLPSDFEGYCILNGNKMFSKGNEPKFYDIKHPHPSLKDEANLGGISVTLSSTINGGLVRSDWRNFNNKPRVKQVLGGNRLGCCKDCFDRGHLIAASLLPYAKKINCLKYKWQDFVMITRWCNRANSKETLGMYHFEELVQNTLQNKEAEIEYRVTPVFKDSCELLPRGIIMEAKINNGKSFEYAKNPQFNNSEFNVFIPNAQKLLNIDYLNAEASYFKGMR